MNEISSLLSKEIPELKAVYVFGSFARKNTRQDSDIDIAILPPKPLKKMDIFLLSQHLSEILHRDVDLIDLLSASTVFRFQIISTGKRIYCSDANQCAYFEMLAYSMYYRFNEERKPLLDAIRKRGSIFL